LKAQHGAKTTDLAWESDIEHIEQRGKLHGANPPRVRKTIKRGIDQIGTLGSGNHYIEIQSVEFDDDCRPEEGRILGLVESGKSVSWCIADQEDLDIKLALIIYKVSGRP